ncbi:hypothetical protein [Kitasatospora sp. NPDC002040]|uniref:hypothetical protein n=1 Tax=Kitasatospora sp. NPDC002040 TaxID=3154661 RepID=UPI00331C0488
MSRGRGAAMPSAGYVPPQRLFLEEGRCVVRFRSEQDGRWKDFDFGGFALARPMREALARAFDVHTGPSGQIKALGAAENCFRQLRYFIEVLVADASPPTSPAELRPRHLEEFALQRKSLATGGMVIGLLRALLVHMDGLDPRFAAKCAEWVPMRRDQLQSRGSYNAAEEKAVLDAARKVVRAAAKRIRDNRLVLKRWREGAISPVGEPDVYEFGWILDMVDLTGELARNSSGKALLPVVARHGSVVDLTTALHLSRAEACAFVVLLVRLTGENGGTIIRAPAAHHRPDGGAGPVATAQVDLSKPRRGRRRYMTAAWSDLPTWASAPGEKVEVSARDELLTPFGLYMLAWELSAAARRIMGSDRLLVYWVPKSGLSQTARLPGDEPQVRSGRGFRDLLPQSAVGGWGQGLNLVADEAGEDGKPQRLIVSVGRMRVTHSAREQKPVAQTQRTLADTYLRRDRSSLREYQELVADVLEKEVVKAKSAGSIARMSEADLAEALRHPEAVARRLGVTTEMLRLLVARDADTVLAGCTDNLNSSHSPAGQPCRASFLKCLDCGSARAMPHHLPIQVVARDTIGERRTHMTALRWAERFAFPFNQLQDLLDQAGPAAVARAAGQATDADRELVRRLLDQELDHR